MKLKKPTEKLKKRKKKKKKMMMMMEVHGFHFIQKRSR
jgi:hypothetical protein